MARFSTTAHQNNQLAEAIIGAFFGLWNTGIQPLIDEELEGLLYSNLTLAEGNDVLDYLQASKKTLSRQADILKIVQGDSTSKYTDPVFVASAKQDNWLRQQYELMNDQRMKSINLAQGGRLLQTMVGAVERNAVIAYLNANTAYPIRIIDTMGGINDAHTGRLAAQIIADASGHPAAIRAGLIGGGPVIMGLGIPAASNFNNPAELEAYRVSARANWAAWGYNYIADYPNFHPDLANGNSAAYVDFTHHTRYGEFLKCQCNLASMQPFI